MARSQNIIGTAVQESRRNQSLSQAMVAAKCSILGWSECSENTISKIETGIRCVNDVELVFLARALRVKLRDLLPEHPELF